MCIGLICADRFASFEYRRERTFEVTITYNAEVNRGLLQENSLGEQFGFSQEIIQVFDVVLRSTINLKKYVSVFFNLLFQSNHSNLMEASFFLSCSYTPISRSLFSYDLGYGDLEEGLEFWKGFYQSLRPTMMGLSLNIGTFSVFIIIFLCCWWFGWSQGFIEVVASSIFLFECCFS